MSYQVPPYPQGPPPPMGFQPPGGFQPMYHPSAVPGYPQPGYPQPGYPGQGGYPPPTYNAEEGYPDHNVTSGYEDAGNAFSDKNVRRGFIRKVYGILMCQLLLTMIIIVPFVYHKPTRAFAQTNRWFYWMCYAFVFAFIIALSCCPSIRLKSPQNYIVLALFTTAEGLSLGCVCSLFSGPEVLMAVGITAAVCLALTLFAFQTKWDFTAMGGILTAALVVFLLFGIIAMFMHGKIITLVYASLGALLFSVYIVYDTQLLMGGKHKCAVSPEDYIGAVLSLYVDIINLFMMILTLIGASRGD